MEIFTLLKANIRKKKGTIISIIILTALAVAVIVAIPGVTHNYREGMERAREIADVGEITAFGKKEKMTDELKEKVENSALVEKVVYYEGIGTNGSKVGNHEDANSAFLTEMRDGILVFNEKRNGFVENPAELEAGEIYLPLGLRAKLSCEVGDIISIDFIMGVKKEFKIKGFVQEPVQGAMMIGFKQMYISKADYDTILEECHRVQTEDISADVVVAQIYQNPDIDMSVTEFQRELNLETKVIASCIATLSKDESMHYSMLMTDVVLNIVLVFAIFLFVIVLIVMAHSISTEIEIDYVTLGVLKAQGFTKEKLRQLFFWQYGLAEGIGILLGFFIAAVLQKVVGMACMGSVGTLPTSQLINSTGLLLVLGMVVISYILIHISSAKVVAISPMRAISGGRDNVYFDHLFTLPISKRALVSGLAFRQFTSAKKRYAGGILIVAILTFFMVSVNLLGNLLNMETAGDTMGVVIPDIDIVYAGNDGGVNWNEIDEVVKEHSAINNVNSVSYSYKSLNGENLACEVYDNAGTIPGIMEGREPLYDNEIVITEFVAETLDISVGDEVTVAQYDQEETYLISGIYQSLSDTGMVFAMGKTGLERLLDAEKVFNNRYYVLEDKEQLEIIEEKLKEAYGDRLEIEVFTEENNPLLNEFGTIIVILKIIIHVFSVIFAAVAIRMVCTKAFLQERNDIGIYKALGFTSTKLRMQFAVRFLLVAFIGAVLGVLLSLAASTKVIGLALRLTGIVRLVLIFTFESVALPVVFISVSCMVFAYIASSKVKKVEVRELVAE